MLVPLDLTTHPDEAQRFAEKPLAVSTFFNVPHDKEGVQSRFPDRRESSSRRSDAAVDVHKGRRRIQRMVGSMNRGEFRRASDATRRDDLRHGASPAGPCGSSPMLQCLAVGRLGEGISGT